MWLPCSATTVLSLASSRQSEAGARMLKWRDDEQVGWDVECIEW